MRVFSYFLKTRILSTLSYKFNVVFMILSSLMILIINVAIWECLYENNVMTSNVSLQQMIVYTIMSTILSNLFYTNASGKLASAISSGSISYDLCRPFSYLVRYFGEDIGDICSAFLMRSLPMFLLACVLVEAPLPYSGQSFLLFLLSTVFCYCILWLIDAIFGIINFWTLGFGNLGQVSNALVRILSGSFVPLWFFPAKIQNILYLTPFPYSYQSALSIYVGVILPGESFRILQIQFIWIIFLMLLLIALYKKANKKLVIQGG